MLRVWKWLRESGLRWVAIVLATLTASVTGWLRGTFDTILRESLPPAAEISCIGREWVIGHRPFRQPEPKRQVFRVLVAALDHDDADRRSTGAIVRALQGEKGIEAIKTCRVLPIEGAGVRIEEPVAMQGREWLSQRDADVLVFGETIEKGALNLHFLAPKGSIDFRQNAFKLESGLLKEEFKEALASQLQSFVFATVDISDENRGRYLVEALRPVAARLEQLLLYPPSGLSARQLAAVQLARGVALTKIGYQADDNTALRSRSPLFAQC
jgi:hypothetical protein